MSENDRRDKRPAEPKQTSEPSPLATDAGRRVADKEGDVGFRGGRRPDRGGTAAGHATERGRPRDTGRQGA